MDIERLEELLKKNEGPKLDFKAILKLETESEKKELAKDVIAIKNSKGGRGYIVFGVRDKTKEIIGIDPCNFNEEAIQRILCSRVDPPIPISVDILDYKGQKVSVLSIFKDNKSPHQMIQTGTFYIRRGSTTDIAKREEVADMLQTNGLISYELTVLRNATIDDLDQELLKKYLYNLNFTGDKPNEIILEGLGFVGKDDNCRYRPTMGGMLMFGKNIRNFMSNSFIEIINNNDIKYFYDNIPNMLENVENYFKNILNPNYPIDNLIQAVKNAIVHRNYFDMTRGIVIEVRNKNIIITNPGALISGYAPYLLGRDKNPRRRNAWLYQRLLTLDGDENKITKDALGIAKIKEVFKDQAKFVNIGKQDLFKVTLPKEF